MPDYGNLSPFPVLPVANQINNLSQQLWNLSRQRYAHELDMANLGLRGQQMENQLADTRGRNQLALEQAKRKADMERPITAIQAIAESNLSDQQKAAAAKTIQQLGLENYTAKKGDFWEAYNRAVENRNQRRFQAERDKASQNRQVELLGLNQRFQAEQADKDRALKARQIELMGLGKDVPVAQKKYADELNTQRFMAQFGLKPDPETGQISSQPMDAETAGQMKAVADQMGLQVFFDQGTTVDKGSRWNPFDNKDVPSFSVRAVVPARGSSLADMGISSSGGSGGGQVGLAQQAGTAGERPPASGKQDVAGDFLSKYSGDSRGTGGGDEVNRARRIYDPGRPETWTVRKIRNGLSVITENGPVQMTDEQIEQWKQTEEGAAYFQSPIKRGRSGRTDDRREQMRRSFVRQPPM